MTPTSFRVFFGALRGSGRDVQWGEGSSPSGMLGKIVHPARSAHPELDRKVRLKGAGPNTPTKEAL